MTEAASNHKPPRGLSDITFIRCVRLHVAPADLKQPMAFSDSRRRRRCMNTNTPIIKCDFEKRLFLVFITPMSHRHLTALPKNSPWTCVKQVWKLDLPLRLWNCDSGQNIHTCIWSDLTCPHAHGVLQSQTRYTHVHTRGDSRIRPLGGLSPQWECDMDTVPCKSVKPPCW